MGKFLLNWLLRLLIGKDEVGGKLRSVVHVEVGVHCCLRAWWIGLRFDGDTTPNLLYYMLNLAEKAVFSGRKYECNETMALFNAYQL